MTDSHLYRAVARATGEDESTIARQGFVVLTRGPVERDYPSLTGDDDTRYPTPPRHWPRRLRRARSQS